MADKSFDAITTKPATAVALSATGGAAAKAEDVEPKMFAQFFSIGVMVLAIVATFWSTFLFTFFSDGEMYYVFALRNQSFAISELKLSVILSTITYCGTFGIRRLFYNRARRRRKSSE